MNIENNKRKVAFLIPILIIVMAGVAAAADDPQARAIMEKVDARNDGDNQTADMEMVLIDKKGQKRIRKIKTFSKDKGDDTYRLMFFVKPADVKNTAFLTYDYDNPEKTMISGFIYRRCEKPNGSPLQTKAAALWARISTTRI